MQASYTNIVFIEDRHTWIENCGPCSWQWQLFTACVCVGGRTCSCCHASCQDQLQKLTVSFSLKTIGNRCVQWFIPLSLESLWKLKRRFSISIIWNLLFVIYYHLTNQKSRQKKNAQIWPKQCAHTRNASFLQEYLNNDFVFYLFKIDHLSSGTKWDLSPHLLHHSERFNLHWINHTGIVKETSEWSYLHSQLQCQLFILMINTRLYTVSWHYTACMLSINIDIYIDFLGFNVTWSSVFHN